MLPCWAIVARAKNGVIGNQGTLPWRIPEDLRYFKATTMGHPIIMGRKTWDSIGGKPLKGRPNIVLTGQPQSSPSAHYVCGNIQEALRLSSRLSSMPPFIIGGAAVYDAALPVVTKLFITEIDQEFAGDVTFPPFREHLFQEVSRTQQGVLTFRVLERKSPPPPR